VAGPLFVFGDQLKGGLHGDYPALDDLDNGDLKHRIDFRSVYATILEQWMQTNPEPVLRKAFPTLDFLRAGNRGRRKISFAPDSQNIDTVFRGNFPPSPISTNVLNHFDPV
jgi:hypothetical protein